MYCNDFKKPFFNQNNSALFGFHNEMGNILNSILQRELKNETEEKKELWFKPRIDVFETKNNYTVTTELAGVIQSDIHVAIEKNVLTISGEKKAIEHDKETTVFKSERNFGKFSRSIELPENANPEVTEAEFKDGVLKITIEKHTITEPKKIEIRIA